MASFHFLQLDAQEIRKFLTHMAGCSARLFTIQTNIIKSFWTRHDDNPKNRSTWIVTKSRIDREYRALTICAHLSICTLHPARVPRPRLGHSVEELGASSTKQHHTVLGVIASHPPSVVIYKHWGFEEVEVVRMQQEGEPEYVDIHVLRHGPPDN